MNTLTKSQIIDFIEDNQKVRPHDLVRKFGFTPAAIHRHLKNLLLEKKIEKLGSSPLVFYRLAENKSALVDETQINQKQREYLQNKYLYISPDGHLLPGWQGFKEWAVKTSQSANMLALVNEFEKVQSTADDFYKGKLWIEVTEKIRSTFFKTYLDHLLYGDFYSLPKFGKTILGQYVLYAKQSQSKKLIHELAEKCKPTIETIIARYKIDALGWVPHSIPRKVPFLKEFRSALSLDLPVIEIVKAYSGEIPVPQKSLSKLEERMINAEQTIFLKSNSLACKRILLIDDAVGSGATMNEVAKKIKEINSKITVIGYAIVGSYKEFEVIKEV